MPKDQWWQSIRKFPVTIPVSREVALDHGIVEPTEEEKAAKEARYAELSARHELDRQETAAWLGRLATVIDPIAVAVLALHARDERNDCVGCDFDGYDGESPWWPCRTVRLVAEDCGCPAPKRVAFNEWPGR